MLPKAAAAAAATAEVEFVWPSHDHLKTGRIPEVGTRRPPPFIATHLCVFNFFSGRSLGHRWLGALDSANLDFRRFCVLDSLAKLKFESGYDLDPR